VLARVQVGARRLGDLLGLAQVEQRGFDVPGERLA